VKKVDFVDVPSAQKTAKVVQESMAGGPTATCCSTAHRSRNRYTSAGFYSKLTGRPWGLLRSPALTPTAYMIIATTAPYAALCNTNLVKGRTFPQSWNDMNRPEME